MKRLVLVLTVFLVAQLSSSHCFAQLYKYTTENGSVHFTDDPNKIPEQYQEKSQIRDGGSKNMIQRVRVANNQVLVPVTISYQGQSAKAEMLLDTGAMSCTITPELARRLNIQPEDSKVAVAQVAGGGMLLVGSTSVDSLDVGPKSMSNVEVMILPGGDHDGLLGMNFLREFDYRINIADQTINWSY